jgi:predicted transcriptional regulator
MSTIRDDLASFHRFASDRLASGETPESLEELLSQWHDLHDRDAVNAAIRRGIADVDAGRCESAEQSVEDLRREFGFAKE